ncbi:hypothetical protein MACH10_27600 [Thalassospira tepidiphila]|uniref:hypothetical protein n=1 Tax=Thalassospira tepidiphila TaxID=393657 RepID=UPI0029244ACB|nr:hypothetical protein MACH10_27600 [Thalassospira tepidiphila]
MTQRPRKAKQSVVGFALATLFGCVTNSAPTYQSLVAKIDKPGIPFLHNYMTKAKFEWPQIGQNNAYDIWIRSNVVGGRFYVYGTQNCLGHYDMSKSEYAADGHWIIICENDSLAKGTFLLSEDRRILARGQDQSGQSVTWQFFDVR